MFVSGGWLYIQVRVVREENALTMLANFKQTPAGKEIDLVKKKKKNRHHEEMKRPVILCLCVMLMVSTARPWPYY